MLVNTLVYINTLIFIAISLLHFYWAFGGKWGAKAAIPERFHKYAFKATGKLAAAPFIPTIIVALGLLIFATITYSHSGNIELPIAAKYIGWATWAMAFIFTARAIGNFSYVGFFKTDKEGLFAEKDSQIFSPLCLYLGMSLAFLNFMS